MFSPFRKSHQLLAPINYSLIDLPAPVNLSLAWNFGSLLGLCLSIQIITGLLLAMQYSPHTDIAFLSISHICRNVDMGWLLRNTHANGASMFFLCLYLHMMRGLYYSSYTLPETWNLGISILIISMATAFMGYLLPWGQMSFWGATVITNLFSAIPYAGKLLVEWLWGGFGVSNPTLTRFFALHFLLPFIIATLAIAHLIFLHNSGSSNPLGTEANPSKTPFHPYYTTKDLMGMMFLILALSYLSFFYPNLLTDPENFIPANPLVTPTHIKPEWYFLWAYAILRSVPNKLGGVVTMFSALLIFYILPLSTSDIKSSSAKISGQNFVFMFILTTTLLTWIGGCPVEPPYNYLGSILTTTYFMFLALVVLQPRMHQFTS